MATIMDMKKTSQNGVAQDKPAQGEGYTVKFKELKDFLYSVKESQKKVNLLKRRISFWEDALGIRSATPSDMPKNPNPSRSPMEDRIVNVIELEKELAEAEAYLKVNRIKICDLVSRLDNVSQQEVIMKKYIDLMSWEQIADDLGVTVRWAQKLHGKALLVLDEELKAMLKRRDDSTRLSVWNGKIIKGNPPIHVMLRNPRL